MLSAICLLLLLGNKLIIFSEFLIYNLRANLRYLFERLLLKMTQYFSTMPQYIHSFRAAVYKKFPRFLKKSIEKKERNFTRMANGKTAKGIAE